MKRRDTKKAIVKEATALFYNYGFRDTSLEMIANELDINKQLITYHFGSKEMLGKYVFEQINQDHINVISEACAALSVKSILYANSVYVLWLPRYLKRDLNARRFYEEMLLVSDIDINVIKSNYIANSMYRTDDADRWAVMPPAFTDYLVSSLSARWLLHYYCKGDLNISEDEFEKKYYFLNCDPFFTDHKRLERVYQGAKAVFNNLLIEEKQNFEIVVKTKNSPRGTRR